MSYYHSAHSVKTVEGWRLSDFRSVHSVETVVGWNAVTVGKFLNSMKDIFSLNDTEIRKFEDNGISGITLLGYTEEKLMQNGLRRGPAINIAKYIAQINSQSKFYHKIV
jgi:hypothetical protein